jgi:hypothetical protein
MSEQAPNHLPSASVSEPNDDLYFITNLAAAIKKKRAEEIADEIHSHDPISLLRLLGGSSASGGGGGASASGGPSASGGGEPDFAPFSNLTSNKAVDALEKLYNGATYATKEWDHSPMMRMMARMKTPFDKEAAKELLAPLDRGQSVFVDHFQNQSIKVTMTPTGISTKEYDINHGEGRAKKVLG